MSLMNLSDIPKARADRKRGEHVSQRVRNGAVKAVASGWSTADVAAYIGVHFTSIHTWIRQAKETRRANGVRRKTKARRLQVKTVVTPLAASEPDPKDKDTITMKFEPKVRVSADEGEWVKEKMADMKLLRPSPEERELKALRNLESDLMELLADHLRRRAN